MSTHLSHISSLAETHTIGEMAAQLGVDHKTVRHCVRKLGLNPKVAQRGRPVDGGEPDSLGLGCDWQGEFRDLLTPETRARLIAHETNKK